MALIKSISGIRGTIGGKVGDSLTPLDVVRFTAAYGTWIGKQTNPGSPRKVVVGRDGRISGPMVQGLVVNTLISLGIDVFDLGLSTTPTVEMAVKALEASGGIILTASHNPKEWNALKLLNHNGEFVSAEDGEDILDYAVKENFKFATVDKLGSYHFDDKMLLHHIDTIVSNPLVDISAITNAQFKVVLDPINSSGATAVPALLRALGLKDISIINETANGQFAHNPEPLPQHLRELSNEVNRQKADIGIAVDPDVDRLCFVCEDGSMFGEEYTLVAVADYVLKHKPGNTVSNLSSTRALKDITEKHKCTYTPSAVGEVNVVAKMKSTDAVIGGEGNGGIIFPELHYGRDAMIGIALFLSHLAHEKKSTKQLRNMYPNYFMSKNKIEIDPGVEVKKIFSSIQKKYKKHPINTEDGLKIEFDNDWVHLRTSNTENIIRIYAESNFETTANNIALRLMQDIREAMQPTN